VVLGAPARSKDLDDVQECAGTKMAVHVWFVCAKTPNRCGNKNIMTMASDSSWNYRRQGGDDRMAKANDQVLWLLRRLSSIIISKKETDDDGVVGGGRRSHDDATAAVMRDAGCSSLTFGGNRVSETTTINTTNNFALRKKDTQQLTIFDLNHLAGIYWTSDNDYSLLSLLMKSLEMDEQLEFFSDDVKNWNVDDDQNDDEEEMRKCWNAMINDDPRTKQLNNLVSNISSPTTILSPSSWEDLLLLPHRTAAAHVLSCNNMEVSKKCATTSADVDVDVNEESIHEYLLRHASQTHEKMEHFQLPSLRKHLLLHEEHYHQQERRLKRIGQMYDTAFEKWDDFCTDVLGVESSDSLPSFPNVSMDENESNLQCIISEYTKEVGMHVVDSMRDEFDTLSIRFFHSLSSPPNNNVTRTKEDTKCHGEDFINAIHHYRQFTSFTSIAASSSPGCDNVENNTAGEDEENESTNLATLYRFVMSSSHNEKDDSTTGRGALITEFKTSPITRGRLIGDLQQLEAFLASRKQELSSHRSLSSAHRVGRDVIDAIELEWTQFCMMQSSPPLSQSPVSSLEDITRYHSSTCNILSQIHGNGSAMTTRMSFLADNVGVVPTIDHDDVNSDCFTTSSFGATCRNAALLAHRLALYQCAQEASTNVVEACALAVGSTREEISRLERRIIKIRDGLNESFSHLAV